ncbi:uncharacterized protein [Musca autumnalis]|uniref:uncharacterized protein n=1 Tax=Musca autumnalis TaxID=221902 RepID=UPI003CF23E86
MDKYCRLCAVMGNDHQRLYDENNHPNEIQRLVEKHFSAEFFIVPWSNTFRWICRACTHHLSVIDEFQEIVFEAQRKLMEMGSNRQHRTNIVESNNVNKTMVPRPESQHRVLATTQHSDSVDSTIPIQSEDITGVGDETNSATRHSDCLDCSTSIESEDNAEDHETNSMAHAIQRSASLDSISTVSVKSEDIAESNPKELPCTNQEFLPLKDEEDENLERHEVESSAYFQLADNVFNENSSEISESTFNSLNKKSSSHATGPANLAMTAENPCLTQVEGNNSLAVSKSDMCRLPRDLQVAANSSYQANNLNPGTFVATLGSMMQNNSLALPSSTSLHHPVDTTAHSTTEINNNSVTNVEVLTSDITMENESHLNAIRPTNAHWEQNRRIYIPMVIQEEGNQSNSNLQQNSTTVSSMVLKDLATNQQKYTKQTTSVDSNSALGNLASSARNWNDRISLEQSTIVENDGGNNNASTTIVPLKNRPDFHGLSDSNFFTNTTTRQAEQDTLMSIIEVGNEELTYPVSLVGSENRKTRPSNVKRNSNSQAVAGGDLSSHIVESKAKQSHNMGDSNSIWDTKAIFANKTKGNDGPALLRINNITTARNTTTNAEQQTLMSLIQPDQSATATNDKTNKIYNTGDSQSLAVARELETIMGENNANQRFDTGNLNSPTVEGNSRTIMAENNANQRYDTVDSNSPAFRRDLPSNATSSVAGNCFFKHSENVLSGIEENNNNSIGDANEAIVLASAKITVENCLPLSRGDSNSIQYTVAATSVPTPFEGETWETTNASNVLNKDVTVPTLNHGNFSEHSKTSEKGHHFSTNSKRLGESKQCNSSDDKMPLTQNKKRTMRMSHINSAVKRRKLSHREIYTRNKSSTNKDSMDLEQSSEKENPIESHWIPKFIPALKYDMSDTEISSDNECLQETPRPFIDSVGVKSKRGAKNSSFKRHSKRLKTQEEYDDLIAEWKPSLECRICHVTCPRFKLLQQHFAQQHPSEECYIECCQHQLRYRYEIEKHIVYHQADVQASKCDICYSIFTRRGALNQHISQKHPEVASQSLRTFKCNDCGKVFFRKALLQYHQPYCKGDNRNESNGHICPDCGKSYKSKDSLSRHKNSTHIDQSAIFQCPICDKIVKNKIMLNYHVKSHTHINESKQKHVCFWCPSSCTTVQGLRTHIQYIHPIEYKKYWKNQSMTMPKDTYNCNQHETQDQTPNTANQRNSQIECRLPGDLQEGEEENPFESHGIPNFKPALKYDISDTEMSSDKECLPETRSSSKSKRRANSSSFRYPSKRPVTQEEYDDLIAEWKPNLECRICHDTCPRFKLLQQHFAQQHSSEECYIECCHLQLRYRYELEKHIFYHQDDRAFKCEICYRSFTVNSALTQHLLEKHTQGASKSLKTFKCNDCGRVFQGITKFQYHQPNCKGYKRNESNGIICTDCGKSYKNKNNLKQHIKKEHSGPTECVQCPICDKIVKCKHTLKIHLRSHTNERKYVCFWCPSSNKTAKYRRQHMLDLHPVEFKKYCREQRRRKLKEAYNCKQSEILPKEIQMDNLSHT